MYERAKLVDKDTSIAIHTNISTLDTGVKIEIRGGKNAQYRSSRTNGKSI